jgi:hypothetical protein
VVEQVEIPAVETSNGKEVKGTEHASIIAEPVGQGDGEKAEEIGGGCVRVGAGQARALEGAGPGEGQPQEGHEGAAEPAG